PTGRARPVSLARGDMSSVLIIDDDLDIRREVSEILREEGLEVMTASNGGEALRLLRPALPAIPVLVFSSFDRGPRNAAELHAAGFLTKPCSIADLLAAIEPFR